jgi:hypothetical protein
VWYCSRLGYGWLSSRGSAGIMLVFWLLFHGKKQGGSVLFFEKVKQEMFLDQFDTFLFDLDGVITSEVAYWIPLFSPY